MKKLFLIAFFTLASLFNFADAKIKIETSKVNKTTKELTIETSWHSFSTDDKKSLPNMHIRFIYSHGHEFMELKYISNANTNVNTNDKITVVLDKNKEIMGHTIHQSSATVGGGSIDYIGCHSLGINLMYLGDFKELLLVQPKEFKIETSDKTIVIKIPKYAKKDIQKLYKLFFNKVNKEYTKLY